MSKLYDTHKVEGRPGRTHSAPKCTLWKCAVAGDEIACPFYEGIPAAKHDAPGSEFACRAGGVHDWRLGAAMVSRMIFHCTKCLDIKNKRDIA